MKNYEHTFKKYFLKLVKIKVKRLIEIRLGKKDKKNNECEESDSQSEEPPLKKRKDAKEEIEEVPCIST